MPGGRRAGHGHAGRLLWGLDYPRGGGPIQGRAGHFGLVTVSSITIICAHSFIEANMSATPPAAGDLAPDFELPDENGQKHKLSDFRGRRVVLYFYPADNTAGCTKQACAFRDAYPTIEEQNAVVIGISPDGAESHRKFKTKYNLPFVLLSDVDHKVLNRYGIWGEKNNYGVKSIGVIRSHFVIDETGHVIDTQVKVRAVDSAEKALASLKS